MKTLTPSTVLVAVLVLFLGAGVLVPAQKLGEALWDGMSAACWTPYYGRAFLNTLMIGTAVAAAATLLGFIAAYALAVARIRGRVVVKALYLTPLFAPSVMPAIGLIYLVGSNGLILQTELYGPAGLFWGGLIFALPHAILQISLSLETLDKRLLIAAESLGAGYWRRLRTIVFTYAAKGMTNAFLITFILTVTDFGVPKLLGGSFPVLATEIYYEAIGSQNFAAAAVLSLWLLLPAVLAFWCSSRLKQRNTVGNVAVFDLHANPLRDLVANLCVWGIVLALAASIGIVIYGSFITFWPYVPELTLENFLFRSSTYGLRPWVNSLVLSFSVAVLGTAAAFAGAYACLRASAAPSMVRIYRAAASFPLCVPGTVLGLGFALAYSGLSLFSGFVGSMMLLVFNTTIHLYTVPHLTAVNVLSQIDRRYESVGRSLGVPGFQTLLRVVLPLSQSGIAEIFTYLFASAMTTISAVVFLYKPASIVAAVAVIDLIDSGFISEGAAMSTLIFASVLAVRLLTLRLMHAAKTL